MQSQGKPPSGKKNPKDTEKGKFDDRAPDRKTMAQRCAAKKGHCVCGLDPPPGSPPSRYGYRLVGVISRDANQAMVVAGRDHIGVSFRGTANTENVRTDLKAWMTMYAPHAFQWHLHAGGSCIGGGIFTNMWYVNPLKLCITRYIYFSRIV